MLPKDSYVLSAAGLYVVVGHAPCCTCQESILHGDRNFVVAKFSHPFSEPLEVVSLMLAQGPGCGLVLHRFL